MPPAPERLSTTTDLPRSFSSACATGRAARSACPPGGNGTTIVMLRKGQPCAAADEKKGAIIGDAKVDPTSAPCRNLRRCTSILPGVISFPRTGRFPRLWQVCSANDLFGRGAQVPRAGPRDGITQNADLLHFAFDDIARQAVARRGDEARLRHALAA